MSLENIEAVRLRLEDIAARKGGRITPEDVIDDARHRDSPLHVHFTWENKAAAHKQRLHEARTLLRSVRINVIEHGTVMRQLAYLRDPEKAAGDQGYISVSILRTETDLARAAMVAEFGRAAAAMRRALEVAKALNLEDDVQTQLRAIERLKERVETRPEA